MSKNSGQRSQTSEKSSSSNAGTSDGTGYRFGSLKSVINMPTFDNNKKSLEKPSVDPIPEKEMGHYSNLGSGANGDKLDQEIKDLMQAEQKREHRDRWCTHHYGLH